MERINLDDILIDEPVKDSMIVAHDEHIKQLFDELDAMQHRVDELTEKVDQLVADMEDIARVFGAGMEEGE